MTLWLIRTGPEQEKLAYNHNVITIRWNALPDLRGIDKEALTEVYRSVYLARADRGLPKLVGQIWNFVYAIQNGDIVVTPLKLQQKMAVGIVKGDYEFNSQQEKMRHLRKVKWLGVFPRAKLSPDLLNSTRTLLAVCKIRKNDAERQLIELTLNRHYPIDALKTTTSRNLA